MKQRPLDLPSFDEMLGVPEQQGAVELVLSMRSWEHHSTDRQPPAEKGGLINWQDNKATRQRNPARLCLFYHCTLANEATLMFKSWQGYGAESEFSVISGDAWGVT